MNTEYEIICEKFEQIEMDTFETSNEIRRAETKKLPVLRAKALRNFHKYIQIAQMYSYCAGLCDEELTKRKRGD